jgi:anti-sigma regulatory factor (Ser/Thr protein kinase)
LLRRRVAMDDTPLHSTWCIASTPQAVSRLRAVIRDAIQDWDLPLDDDQLHTLLLLSTELTTNALRYGDQESITVEISVESSLASIRVSDGDAQAAGSVVASSASPEAETGRGLALVTFLATRWSVERTEHGKAVTAELALTAIDERIPAARGRSGFPAIPCGARSRTCVQVLASP